MKLYLSPGACSMSCHIAFEEARVPFEPMIADDDHQALWQDIEKLNPQGSVPVLVLDNGSTLLQNIAILTYVAERAPDSGLLPKAGTVERAQVYQWVSWVGADLHKTFGPLFGKNVSDEKRQEIFKQLDSLFSEADKHLAGKDFIVGNQFTIADAYLFTVYGWTDHVKVPTDKYRNLNAYRARIAERPAVQTVLKREGLLD